MSIHSIFSHVPYSKILAPVEVDTNVSGQHEFNGTVELKSLLGLDRRTIPARFSLLGGSAVSEVNITWYDSRERDPNRSEHRLYFQTNPVMAMAAPGDCMLIGFDNNNVLNFVLSRA
ncbi:type II restriction endonuclease [Pseudomonas sp. CFBP13508]|uniref:type II restriction endonuclease n=1 Tax=Pseudomonas sp. CFBP13508 TaxID=2184009 RepID=UPI0010BFA3AF|nr:type II restriction endonuclease [Pseudomonas sp. CFBP13508]